MSPQTGANRNASAQLGPPRGEILGRYDSYLDAQKVVDYLADHDFPVAGVSIIGNDLMTVERVTAKLSYPKVALAGAAQGAMFGIFVGLILSIFGPEGGLTQILSSVGLGMAIWMIVGVVSYSFRKGKRDFSSSSQVMATSYDVVVAFEHAAAARQLAAKLPMSRVEAQQVTPAWAPPRQHGAAGSPGHEAPSTSAGAAPEPTAGEPRHDEGHGTPETGKAPGADAPTRPSSASYSDLPDGRPQYGVRVTPEHEPTPEAESTAQADQQPAEGTRPGEGEERTGGTDPLP
ncbi:MULTISPECIES: general stress protein [Micrococcaceae]|uniref:General stress protein 17M-like domain-containing protein n=2 Tax=Arthrobacter rhombi TaxID=71253 RepID=A0A1R4GKX6_9MICC|nr:MULTISPECIES: general stress protein [Micrococcaceae]PCC24938.1 hypothetical protein CIK75_12395 [Glutamicibacter sp. BW78]SJM68848.1 hypothetical protein FM101_11330 [Arthrobacter rhombi]